MQSTFHLRVCGGGGPSEFWLELRDWRGGRAFSATMPSTIIRSFDYRPATSELEVLFTTGRRYLYREVPPEAAAAFRAAFSKGRHFNAHIRNHYPYMELGVD